MPTVTFKAKARDCHYVGEDAPRYQYVEVPALTRAHCDMAAFRSHPRFGSYANSDLFPSILKRALSAAGVGSRIRLDEIPPSVTVTPGFLHVVTISVEWPQN